MNWGSPSSSLLFIGTTETTDHNMELMTNYQQESNLASPTSLILAQHDHPFAPNNQRNQPQASYPNEDLAIEVSPTTLLDTSRYLCEICNKGFPRKQNLSLHLRVHKLPFTLKKRAPSDALPRKVYLCPEPTCVHHNRSHAIGDFGGLKKHYLRKHSTEKNHKCDNCNKAYGVESDLTAHTKVCAKKKYVCHRGYPIISRDNYFTAKDPQTLMGDSSIKSTANNNNNIPIGSTMSHPQTFMMEGTSVHPQTFTMGCTSHPQTFAMGGISHPQTFRIGGMSHIQTFRMGGTSHPQTFGMGGTSHPQNFGMRGMSHAQTFGMGDNAIKNNSNESINTIIGPQNWSIQSNPCISTYQSQLSQFGADYSSLIADPSMVLNFSHETPAFFSPTSIHQDQQGYQEYYDVGFHADMLRDNIPLHNINLDQDMSLMGDCGIVYGTGESSNSVLDGGFVVDSLSSLNLTPTMHNLSANEMLNPLLIGSNDGGSYEQGGYSGYGLGSEHLEYRGGIEGFNFEHQQQATGGSLAPFELHSNQL